MSSSTPQSSSSTPPEAAWTVRRLLDWIRKYLGEKEVDSPRVCAELLLGHVLNCERLRLYMTPDLEPSADQLDQLRALVARAASHEPVQYLVGSWPFHGREFEVAPCTLIPRPATELLVDFAIDEIKAKGIHRGWKMLDLCTGSGCISVSILASLQAARNGPLSERFTASQTTEQSDSRESERIDEVEFDLELQPVQTSMASPSHPEMPAAPEPAQEEQGAVRLIATDIDSQVVELAKRNAERHGVEHLIDLRIGSLWEPLFHEEQGSFDIICANPPYVSDSEYLELDRNVRDFEPARALRGGPDGLDLVRPIIRNAPEWLRSGGVLLVEVGAHSAAAALDEVKSDDRFHFAEIHEDHEGFPRMLVARIA